jgi:hypothetical protein
MAFDYYNVKRQTRLGLKEMLALQGFNVSHINWKGLTSRQIAGMATFSIFVDQPAMQKQTIII